MESMMATGSGRKGPRQRSNTLGPIPKTMRHVYCSDQHWETCERMAADFDCSVDYIINEAMRYYARSKNYHPEMPAQAKGVGTPKPTPPEPVPIPTREPILYLFFDGQRYTIDKDHFTIGRGSKTSDLPIKDSNISRKHAIVFRQHGTFYIKDLGSTNGIGYRGTRIDNRRIDEGDIFYICDHELRFTYR